MRPCSRVKFERISPPRRPVTRPRHTGESRKVFEALLNKFVEELRPLDNAQLASLRKMVVSSSRPMPPSARLEAESEIELMSIRRIATLHRREMHLHGISTSPTDASCRSRNQKADFQDRSHLSFSLCALQPTQPALLTTRKAPRCCPAPRFVFPNRRPSFCASKPPDSPNRHFNAQSAILQLEAARPLEVR
jgi:hypothetical protein